MIRFHLLILVLHLTVRPHPQLQKLKFRNALIINWFLSLLSSRSQQVKQFNLREFPSPFHLVYYWLLR